jgi:2-polyprenyl-6-methoxyphenol hydroxylase-like FAD-dependent oxidoreductase
MEEKTSGLERVLIVGGGIAGSALGIALRRAGINSVVYEASPAPRDNAGAFLNLAPNGLNVLQALGLAHLTDGLGFRNDRLIFHNETGRMLADVPVGGVTLMRGALNRALREAAIEAGVRFEFGKALESVTEHDGGVVAQFADGTTTSGRLLVGADGIHSRTRYSFFPEAPQPTYTGIINLGGIVQTDLPSTDTAMHMIFGRRGFFGYAVRPSGETFWFSNFAQSEEPARGSLETVDATEFQQRLLNLHRGDPPEVTRILQAVSGNIGAYAVYDIMSLPRWQHSRVCLIGDSAHAVGPHVGQGASLALEDAFMLAKCLRDLPDPATAFTTFEGLRRERVERIVKQSRRTGEQKAPTGWLGRKIRDIILPVFLRQGAQATAWMYAYPLDWEEPIAANTK